MNCCNLSASFCVAIGASVLAYVFWKFRDKTDGFGLKTMFKWWAITFAICTPITTLVDVWEAFADLDYYWEVIKVIVRFISAEVLIVTALDVPLYRSYFEGSHGEFSVIVQDHIPIDASGDDDEDVVKQVMNLASRAGRGIAKEHVALQIRQSDAHAETNTSVDITDTSDVRNKATKVFSSRTLTLGLQEVLLDSLYSAHLASFTQHLVGELSVENLQFYFRVLDFQNFAMNKSRKDSLIEGIGADADHDASAHSSRDDSVTCADTAASNVSEFSDSANEATSTSASTSATGGCDLNQSDAEAAATARSSDAHDKSVARRAIRLYFEFLHKTSMAQV